MGNMAEAVAMATQRTAVRRLESPPQEMRYQPRAQKNDASSWSECTSYKKNHHR